MILNELFYFRVWLPFAAHPSGDYSDTLYNTYFLCQHTNVFSASVLLAYVMDMQIVLQLCHK